MTCACEHCKRALDPTAVVKGIETAILAREMASRRKVRSGGHNGGRPAIKKQYERKTSNTSPELMRAFDRLIDEGTNPSCDGEE